MGEVRGIVWRCIAVNIPSDFSVLVEVDFHETKPQEVMPHMQWLEQHRSDWSRANELEEVSVTVVETGLDRPISQPEWFSPML